MKLNEKGNELQEMDVPAIDEVAATMIVLIGLGEVEKDLDRAEDQDHVRVLVQEVDPVQDQEIEETLIKIADGRDQSQRQEQRTKNRELHTEDTMMIVVTMTLTKKRINTRVTEIRKEEFIERR